MKLKIHATVRATLVVGLGAFSFVACASVLGIEDPTFADAADGATPEGSGGGDASGRPDGSAGVDGARDDGSAPGDGGPDTGGGDGGPDAGGSDGGVRYVFVTTATFQGGVVGGTGSDPLGFADATCTAAAQGAPSGSPLRGRMFKAWLSGADPSQAVRVRFNANAQPSTPPYVLPDQTRVAMSWGDLLGTNTKSLLHGIDMTEAQAQAPGASGAWTGTFAEGSSSAVVCAGPKPWQGGATSATTGTVGSVGAVGTTWTEFATPGCESNAHLYCVED